MPGANRKVTFTRKSRSPKLPSSLNEACVMLQWLLERGILDKIADRLRIRRQGGYPGVDVLIFLLSYFASNLAIGVRDFSEQIRPCHEALAALAGRARMASAAAISRALGRVEFSLIEEFGRWLLLEASDAVKVLKQPAVRTRDALGGRWHVFDEDGKSLVLRQRGLPEDEELPEPERRSHEAAPGYQGRKRGDVQMMRTTLQHAGSSLWLGIWTGPSNGNWSEAVDGALEVIQTTCSQLGWSLHRALLRVDGIAGNVPFIAACRRVGVSFLTRWHSYERLFEPDVAKHLAAARWYPVEDSGAGPKREATDLGAVTLRAGKATRDDDGQPYDPVRVRMTVSRYRQDPKKKKRGVGKLIDGLVYELFVSNLPKNRWPVPDIVTQYYGRTAEENRFNQENKQLRLDRIVSYHLPGQHLANLVAYFVWNLCIRLGLGFVELPKDLPPQRAVDPTDATPLDGDGQGTPADGAQFEEPARAAPVGKALEEEARHSGDALSEILGDLDWSELQQRNPGWCWDPEQARLLCPNEIAASGPTVRLMPEQAMGLLRFRVLRGACRDCSLRHWCSESTSPKFHKEVDIRVQVATAKQIKTLRTAHKDARRTVKRLEMHAGTSMQLSWEPWMTPHLSGPYRVETAPLLPAELRRQLRLACRDLEVEVSVDKPEQPRRKPRLLASSPAERQHRRLTWQQRNQYNALCEKTEVQITFGATSGRAAALCCGLLTDSRVRNAA